MRDEDEGVGIGFEVGLQPVAGFEVEMVGGLVEQQQVRLFEQEFGERDAHLPAAGEFFDAALPVFAAETEAGEHRADARFDVVAVAGGEFGLDVMVAFGDLLVFRGGMIELRHAMREFLLLRLRARGFPRRPQAFGEDGAAGERDAILRQVAGA